jgi:hypothetical protein
MLRPTSPLADVRWVERASGAVGGLVRRAGLADHVTQAMPGQRTVVVTGATALPSRAGCIGEARARPSAAGALEMVEAACAG